jgi:hypothetical protein
VNRFSCLVVGVILGAGLVYGALTYHVLRTESGFEFIPKAQAGFQETYLDVRQFGVSNWTEHQQVAQAVIKAGKEDLLKDSARNSFQRGVDNLLDKIGGQR